MEFQEEFQVEFQVEFQLRGLSTPSMSASQFKFMLLPSFPHCPAVGCTQTSPVTSSPGTRPSPSTSTSPSSSGPEDSSAPFTVNDAEGGR